MTEISTATVCSLIMPLIETAGDAMLTRAQTIAHGVAPGENYPTGFALSLRAKYPDGLKAFKKACKDSRLQPGEYYLWKGPQKWILNLLTQDEAYTKDVRVTKAHPQFLRKTLAAVRTELPSSAITSIALPRVCVGYGKMEWKEIDAILKSEWASLPIPVFLYTDFRPGERSIEENRWFNDSTGR